MYVCIIHGLTAGCPDEEGIRATCWKVAILCGTQFLCKTASFNNASLLSQMLLDYLPTDAKSWDSVLKKRRFV